VVEPKNVTHTHYRLLLIGADLECGALPKVAGHGGVAAPAPLGELRVERGAGFDERREWVIVRGRF
jgi:hypothetical protein